MKRKRRIETRKVYKHKARLNIGGHKQEYGVHYHETYSPVVRWTSIRLMLILSIIQGWSTRQLDFVMAYPQADISTDHVYIEIPKGFEFEGSRDTHCLHVLKNIYGGKDAGQTWNLHLVKGLKELGFDQSKTNECVFFRGSTIFMVYVDNGILIDPDGSKIDQAMNDLQSKFEVQDKGDLSDYLGVKIQKHPDGSIEFTQPQLIDSILEDLKLIGHGGEKSAKILDTPSKHDGKLHRDEGGRVFDYPWDYRSVIGKMNYLEKSTRGDLAFSVHQCARFMSQPMRVHGEAVKRIGRYLLGTRNKGFVVLPDMNKSFECYVDADYCGNWDPMQSEDPNSAKSRTGYVIMYHSCPIMWASRLQSVFALSTTEAEYVALSTALRDVIPVMDLLTEMQEHGYSVDRVPTIKCKLFIDNSGAFEQAKTAKYRPRTRHINAAWHHFRSYVANGLIHIHSIRTDWQLGDTFTKQVSKEDFVKFRWLIFGW
jgi:Reverse transcriptase (RNA-dependent DNA polymerase)